MNIKQLHCKTAGKIALPWARKGLLQLTQLLCTHQEVRTFTSTQHYDQAAFISLKKVEVGDRVAYYSAQNRCTRLKGSLPLHRPERLPQRITALKQNHQDQKCPEFNLKSTTALLNLPFPTRLICLKHLLAVKEKAAIYTHHSLATGSTWVKATLEKRSWGRMKSRLAEEKSSAEE